MAFNPTGKAFGWHWLGNGKSLNMIATKLRQNCMFAMAFDAFGDRANTKLLCHGQHRCDHALLVPVSIYMGDKRAVYLDPVDVETANVRNRCMTGSEVIQVDVAAQASERRNIVGHDFVVTVSDDVFKYFASQTVCGHFEPIQFPTNFFK